MPTAPALGRQGGPPPAPILTQEVALVAPTTSVPAEFCHGIQRPPVCVGGPENYWLKEPGIALGRDSVFVASAAGGAAGQKIVYAWRRRDQPDTWHEGRLCEYPGDVGAEIGPKPTMFDPFVAYDAELDDYLVMVIAKGPPTEVADYTPVVGRFDPTTEVWTWVYLTLPAPGGSVPQHDKPVLLAGYRNEFYAYWPSEIGGYLYRRTTNGGLAPQDWSGGLVQIDGVTLHEGWTIQPTVSAASRLFAAYTTFDGQRYRFLAGQDRNALVNHWPITLPDSSPMEIVPIEPPSSSGYGSLVPGNGQFTGRLAAQTAIDPTNHDRFYVVYHDLECQGSINLSIYIHRVEFDGELDAWAITDRIRVNDEPIWSDCTSQQHADQFLPAVTVDSLGRIHIVYYDDSTWPELDDDDPDPRFQLVHAVSTDNGETWDHQVFGSLVSSDPFLDFGNFATGPVYYDTPREYIAITTYTELDGSVTIAAAAPGTHLSCACSCPPSVLYTLIGQ